MYMYMLGTKYGFGPSVDFAAQTSDRRYAQQSEDRISAQCASKSVDHNIPDTGYAIWYVRIR